MIRIISMIGLALLALVSFGLYNGVTQVKSQHEKLDALKRDIGRERESIRVLKAEWSTLNQPERLQTLARKHLTLAPTGASHITVLAALPFRKTEAGAAAGATRPTRNAPLPRFKPDQ